VVELSHRTSASGRLPVIGPTRGSDLKSKFAAFAAGVDEILTGAFAPEELLARVIALLRRSYSDAVTFTRIIKIGQLEIDILKPTVQAGTSELHLTSLEQSLPHLLAANAGRVVTREEILDTPWGADGLRGGRQRREPPRTESPSEAAERSARASGVGGVHYHGENVSRPQDGSRSLLSLRCRLIELRRATPALSVRSFRTLHVDDDLLVYSREHAGQQLVVPLNLTH
jgi:hypothetical protein